MDYAIVKARGGGTGVSTSRSYTTITFVKAKRGKLPAGEWPKLRDLSIQLPAVLCRQMGWPIGTPLAICVRLVNARFAVMLRAGDAIPPGSQRYKLQAARTTDNQGQPGRELEGKLLAGRIRASWSCVLDALQSASPEAAKRAADITYGVYASNVVPMPETNCCEITAEVKFNTLMLREAPE